MLPVRMFVSWTVSIDLPLCPRWSAGEHRVLGTKDAGGTRLMTACMSKSVVCM